MFHKVHLARRINLQAATLSTLLIATIYKTTQEVIVTVKIMVNRTCYVLHKV